MLDDAAMAVLAPVLSARSREGLAVEAGAMFRRHVGWDLFTILACDHAQREVVRLHSSDPGNHRLGGRKPFNLRVLQPPFVAGQRTHRCSGRAEVAACYANDPGVRAYAAAINIPVVWEGGLVGMVNLLSVEGGVARCDDRALLALAALSLPLFLAA